MSEADLRNRLVETAREVEEALARLAGAMESRNCAVRQALDAGWEPADIASATNLTVGQVWNAGKGDPISPPPLESTNAQLAS